MSEYDVGNEDATTDVPNSTKAYKLFSEGKSPLEVSIALNLRAPEVKTLYTEFWELRRMHSLTKMYKEIGDKGVSSLLQLHELCKAQQISNEQVIEYLTIYSNNLPMVKRQYDEVDVGLQGLMSQKHRTEKELQDLHVTIGFSFRYVEVHSDGPRDCREGKKRSCNSKVKITEFHLRVQT